MRSHPPPQMLVHEMLRQAKGLPTSFYPIPVRELGGSPCFRSKNSKEESDFPCAEAIFRASGDEYYLIFLRAYLTACHKPGGTGLVEAMFAAVGSGPRLPPPSLFAPLGEDVEDVITGLGRTLLKLRFNYELVLPKVPSPTTRDIDQARNVLIDHVLDLARTDADEAKLFIERLRLRLTQTLPVSPLKNT